MRILMLSWEYAPHVISGIGPHIMGLTTALSTVTADQEMSLDIVTPRYAGGQPVERIADNMTVHRVELPWLSGDLYPSVANNNELLAQYAVRCFGSIAPDLLHFHDWYMGVAGLTLKKLWNVPLIATMHRMRRERDTAKLSPRSIQQIDQLEQDIGTEAAHIIVCSRSMGKAVHELLAVPMERLSVIPNGVTVGPGTAGSPEKINSLRQQYAPAGQALLIYVGPAIYSKGVLVLMRALPSILARHPNTRLLLAGDNSASLQPLAYELGVEHAVDFLGYVSNDDRDCLYQVTDAVVIPSLAEPFGMVALEAMAAGANVIASNVGGLSEVIEHMQTGLLVEPGKPESIAQAVDMLLADPDAARKRSQRAIEHVNQAYRWEGIARQTVHLCGKVYSSIGTAQKTDDVTPIPKT